MQSSLVFGVCIVVCLVGELRAQCDRNDDINGCSIPLGLPWFNKRRFTPACNKHDVCYSCGTVKGISQATCDNKFYQDMRQVCSNNFCERTARQYYNAVKKHGHKHFENTSKDWCSQSWVRGCLP